MSQPEQESAIVRNLQSKHLGKAASFCMVTFMRFFLPRAACILIATVFGTALSAAEPIKIGEFSPMTGREAAFGQSSHQGAMLAIEEANAAGGILGRPVVLLTEDTQTKQGEAATAVKKLISRDKVVAIIDSDTSSRSIEAAAYFAPAKIPVVVSQATNPKVTEKSPYVFRVCFIDPFQGVVMAKFSKKTLHVKRVAILASVTSDYSVGLSRYFKEQFTSDGGVIAMEQKYSDGDRDFKAQLTAIKGANVDGLFVPGFYTEAALICRQARELDIKFPIFGGDGWEAPEFVEIGGKSVEGTYYSTLFSLENVTPQLAAFLEKYGKRWSGSKPDSAATLGYDAAKLLLDAMKRAGTTDGAKVRAALSETKDFPGVGGSITIDAERNARKPAVVVTVKNGEFRFVEEIAP